MSAPTAPRRKDRSAPMPLRDHLAELRGRLLVSLVAVAAGAVVGWFLFDPIFDAITAPFVRVVEQAQADGKDVVLALTGVADPFTLQLKVSAVAGFVLSSPVWLFQAWRFVTPGLHRNERLWAVGFVSVALPLFLSGMVLAYFFLPNAIGFLFGFTPDNVSNFVDVRRYLNFFLNTILIFGAGFLLPVTAVLLNFAGVLEARTFIGSWRWVVVGTAVFAAMATPDGSPLTMVALATPIVALFGIAMGVAWLNDRRRLRNADDTPDDRASPLPDPDEAE